VCTGTLAEHAGPVEADSLEAAAAGPDDKNSTAEGVCAVPAAVSDIQFARAPAAAAHDVCAPGLVECTRPTVTDTDSGRRNINRIAAAEPKYATAKIVRPRTGTVTDVELAAPNAAQANCVCAARLVENPHAVRADGYESSGL
jgi:hypothetical protein